MIAVLNFARICTVVVSQLCTVETFSKEPIECLAKSHCATRPATKVTKAGKNVWEDVHSLPAGVAQLFIPKSVLGSNVSTIEGFALG